MLRRKIRSKRLHSTVAANRRKRKVSSLKRKISDRNRIYVNISLK